MKKLLVKAEFIVTPYSPAIEAIEAIEAQPEKWVKGDEVLFEEPMIEVNVGEFETDTSYTYHPAIEAVEGVEGKEEVLEVREWRVIAQTQGTEEELQKWLEGDKHKYPEGYVVEWIDITEEWNKHKAIEEKIELGKRARAACESVLDLISGLNLDRALTVEQITLMQSTFGNIEKALQSNRPSLAKALITQVEADGVIVTQEMKDMSLELLKDF